MPTPIAILTADIHLSHSSPAARSQEPDWYEAMRRQFQWLKELQRRFEHELPIFIAGDIFHKYSPPVELVNFALRELPDNIYAIPGQHDLPYHSLDDIRKSAYWTLMEAGKITNVNYRTPALMRVGCSEVLIRLHGFPFKCPIIPCQKEGDAIEIAIIHEYCWQGRACYLGASEEKSVEAHRAHAGTYDVLVFGDNHIPHEDFSENPVVFNCGGFYRRTIDEVDHRPSVGILYSDLTIKREYVPVQEDIFITKQESSVLEQNISDFVHYLSNTTTNPLDVEEIIRNYVITHNVSELVQIEISRLLEKAK